MSEEREEITGARTAYDPIGDLAGLLAALTASRAASWDGQVGAAYRRLAAGLAWTEPGGIEDAIRAALQAFITRTGHLITPAEIEGWVAEAERGYDIPDAPPPHPELGPGSGHQADGPADCARCQLIRDNAHWMTQGSD